MSPSSGHEWESKVKLVHGSIQTAEDGGGGQDKGDFVVCMCRSRNVEVMRRLNERFASQAGKMCSVSGA